MRWKHRTGNLDVGRFSIRVFLDLGTRDHTGETPVPLSFVCGAGAPLVPGSAPALGRTGTRPRGSV
jgi:hypothetical protein